MDADRGLTAGGAAEEPSFPLSLDFDLEEESLLGSLLFERFLEDDESDFDFCEGHGTVLETAQKRERAVKAPENQPKCLLQF